MAEPPVRLLIRNEDAAAIIARRRVALCAAVCWLGCLLWVDLPVAAWCADHDLSREIVHFLESAEHFGTPQGQLLILGTLFLVYAGKEARLGRIWWGTVAAGMGANLIKLMVARSRPRAFDFHSLSVMDSFQNWMPLGAGGSAVQSFPSAHSASAFGFATLLAWAWPQGRMAFFALAALTAAQRVCSSAHFPSDTILGGLLGWGIARMFVDWKLLANLWTRWEQRWTRWREGKGAESPDREETVASAA